MQRYEVEAIFEQKKMAYLRTSIYHHKRPIAIILGGQPACEKALL